MAKLYATINGAKDPITLERATPSAPWSFGDTLRPDLVRTGPGTFSLVHKGRSFKVLVLKEDKENNTVRLRISAHTYTVRLEDEQARLVHDLGLDKAQRAVVHELKAPMPGLVLRMLVAEGDAVKKNDPVLILEAMKMENVIKSPSDGTVKKIHAQERTAVEKGQLLLRFE
ncbi:MAG: acetyl-CoA carboxylase biotin carboxyl carrier protein subunit [Flavobacteriales bacterium]